MTREEKLEAMLNEAREQIAKTVPGPAIPAAILALEVQTLVQRYIASAQTKNAQVNALTDVTAALASTLAGVCHATTDPQDAPEAPLRLLALIIKRMDLIASGAIKGQPVEGMAQIMVDEAR